MYMQKVTTFDISVKINQDTSSPTSKWLSKLACQYIYSNKLITV